MKRVVGVQMKCYACCTRYAQFRCYDCYVGYKRYAFHEGYGVTTEG